MHVNEQLNDEIYIENLLLSKLRTLRRCKDVLYIKHATIQ